MGKPFLWLSNRWIRGYLMSVPTVILFVGAGVMPVVELSVRLSVFLSCFTFG